MLLTAAALPASVAIAADTCNPSIKRAPEKFDCAPQERAATVCRPSGMDGKLGDACQKAKEADEAAFSSAQQAYRDACAIANRLNAGAASCKQQNNCEEMMSNANDELKRQLQAAVADLEAKLRDMDAARERLVAEIQGGISPAFDENAAGKECKTRGHGGRDDTKADTYMDPATRVIEAAQNPGVAIPSGGTSRLITSQAKLVETMRTAQKKTQDEIDNLRRKANEALRIRDTTGTRGRNLDKNPGGDKPSDVTGTDKPNSSSPQQQGQGSPQQGGGSGGGSPGGGQGGGDQQPSSLTKDGGTSPTPDGQNNGSTASDDASKKKSGTDTSTGTGIVDISHILDPKTPGAARTAVSNPAGGNPTTLSDGSYSGSSTSHKGSGAATANAVGGGGVSAGGTGTLGAKNDGKNDGSGASRPGDGSSSGGGGGGSSGGGGYGGGGSSSGGDEVLSPFGKPLSDPKFALAGSETDASVKNMVGSFAGDENDPNRDPAGGDVSDGIGERDSADLFDRVHAFHERCAQKGCVAGSSKRKVGGA